MRIFLALLTFFLAAVPAPAITDAEVAALQKIAQGLPVGERIALFAEAFVGTPYDPDPLGEYVTRKTIVADRRVDCMYHVFRSAELALSNTPEDAVLAALKLRFTGGGRLDPDGTVANYEDRFQYGLDMLRSGKWGRDVTASLGRTVRMEGSRGVPFVDIIPKEAVPEILPRLRSGDIVYFVKPPEKRTVGEVIGHIGIVKVEAGPVLSHVFLIHASGSKKKGGAVKKLPLADYAREMPFSGIMAGRFEAD